jgi:hypothetical protein
LVGCIFRSGEMQILLADNHPACFQILTQSINLDFGIGDVWRRMGRPQEGADLGQQSPPVWTAWTLRHLLQHPNHILREKDERFDFFILSGRVP